MKKNINLYFKVNLTSQSPDAQIISIGIVSDVFYYQNDVIKALDDVMGRSAQNLKIRPEKEILKEIAKNKSFYSEFNDFDINRCDDSVKENVVGKLLDYFKIVEQCDHVCNTGIDNMHKGDSKYIKGKLFEWLEQFKDYNITFIGDKCSWEWVKLVELIGEWEGINNKYSVIIDSIPPNMTLLDFICEYEKNPISFVVKHPNIDMKVASEFKIGLPKLPENISPEPLDLNTVIAIKKGISVKEASEIDRGSMIGILLVDANQVSEEEIEKISKEWNEHCGVLKIDNMESGEIKPIKHIGLDCTNKNALSYAELVIKEIYQKLMI